MNLFLPSAQECPRVPGLFYLPSHLDSLTNSQLLLPMEGYPHITAYTGLLCFSSQLFLRSLLFWCQLKRVLLSFLRLVSLFDFIVVFPDFMPVVKKSYFHLLIPLKGSDNLIADMAGIPGSYLREVAKGIKYKQRVCAVPQRKEDLIGYTLVPWPTTCVFQ